MFERLDAAPPDPILGLTEAFRADPNPHKINLSVGVYRDASGLTPVLECVKRAEERILRDERTKDYLPISGSPQFAQCVQDLMWGAGEEIPRSGRAATSQTPGGTGALRVAADLIRAMLPGSKVWLSEPTWPNHPNVFAAAGLAIERFPYFKEETNSLDFDPMLDTLGRIPAGDVVLLHGCCHNPTGIDPELDQWEAIAEVLRERKLIPLVDFAYQGLADGLDKDAAGLRALSKKVDEMIVCSSFSKNFGLYRDRVGSLSIVASTPETATVVQSQVKRCIRANYSNPPAHGAAVVTTVLGDLELRSEWHAEVAAMRDRINSMRRLLVETLKSKGVKRDFSFITRQRGMFSFSGLSPEQVDALRDQDSIYVVRSGRINVAGMTVENMDRLCTAMARVLG